MKKIPHLLIIFAFFLDIVTPLKAAEIVLPKPGTMVSVSPSFTPSLLKGIKVFPNDPFRFDFVIDKANASLRVSKAEVARLVKYFMAGVTTPDGDLWVNLSPYEKDRIAPNGLGQTEMGRDLLAQDYVLKQLTASIVYPESQSGKAFWAKVYTKTAKQFGSTKLPVNTFNKVWIVPDQAAVYENTKAGTAYVTQSSLKVLLEADYLALTKASKGVGSSSQKLGTEAVRDVVIPILTKEVNEGKNFAPLRQVYDALILAAWYKKKLRDSVMARIYADQNKTAGITFSDKQTKEKIYQLYLEAFKQGAYNYIREETDPVTQQTIPRKYFSGGATFAMLAAGLKVQDTMDMEQAEGGKDSAVIAQVGMEFVGSTPIPIESKGINRRRLLAAAAGSALGSAHFSAAAEAGSQESASPPAVAVPSGVQDFMIPQVSEDERARLDDILNSTTYDKLKGFVDEKSGFIKKAREDIARLEQMIIATPNAVIVEINPGDVSLRPVLRSPGIGYIQRRNEELKKLVLREALENAKKGIILPNTTQVITDIQEAVRIIEDGPGEILWTGPYGEYFKGRDVYTVRFSSDAWTNPAKYNELLRLLQQRPEIKGRPIIAIRRGVVDHKALDYQAIAFVSPFTSIQAKNVRDKLNARDREGYMPQGTTRELTEVANYQNTQRKLGAYIARIEALYARMLKQNKGVIIVPYISTHKFFVGHFGYDAHRVDNFLKPLGKSMAFFNNDVIRALEWINSAEILQIIRERIKLGNVGPEVVNLFPAEFISMSDAELKKVEGTAIWRERKWLALKAMFPDLMPTSESYEMQGFIDNSRLLWSSVEPEVRRIYTKNVSPDTDTPQFRNMLTLLQYSLVDPIQTVLALHGQDFKETKFYRVPFYLSAEYDAAVKDYGDSNAALQQLLDLNVFSLLEVLFLEQLDRSPTVAALEAKLSLGQPKLDDLVGKAKKAGYSALADKLAGIIKNNRRLIELTGTYLDQFNVMVRDVPVNKQDMLVVTHHALLLSRVADSVTYVGNDAMAAALMKKKPSALAATPTGGIDLNNVNPAMAQNGPSIKFYIDPAMAARARSAAGLRPQVLTILPLPSLKKFLQP